MKISSLWNCIKDAGFENAYFFAVVEDKLFYDGPDKAGIYSYFRSGRTLTEKVDKPTGNKDKSVTISGNYLIKWEPVGNGMKYVLVEV